MRNTLPFFVLLFIFGAIIAALVVPPSAAAQSNSCIAYASCGYSSIGGPCTPTIPSGAYDCQGANFTLTCKLHTYHCPPAKSHVEHPRCIECEKLAAAGKPINLANGNVYVDQTDLSIPGLGGGLTLTRAWNSLWPTTQFNYRTGMFGPNWVSNFEERIFVGDDNYVKYLHSDGNFWSFGFASYSSWLPSAPANAPAALSQTSTNWVLTFKNGEQRLFNLTSGQLTSIIDRNGNTTVLSYDGLNRLITVTDPAFRHLTFTYSGNSYQVTGVSSDVGLSLTYSYDGHGRLLQVTKPDTSKWNYEYDGNPYFYAPLVPNPYLSAIKDGSGKVLESHTYDCYGRGLTSSSAGGVDSVTITYSDGTYSGVCGGGRILSVE